MPGVKISKDLKGKLPADEREGLEDFLWDKSGGRCHLCEEQMNRASDNIEADHDVPKAEGGAHARDNLYLAHSSCNRAKANSPSVDVRPYLKIAAYLRKHDFPKYDGCLAFFGIDPKPSVLTIKGQKARLELPDGAIVESPVFRESNQVGTFDCVFVEVPREAIFNDDECQPRRIKLPQLWAIYQDIQQNPLHEPPSLRVIEVEDRHARLAMFDGQHKTLAAWMAGRQRVITKVYLNLDKDQTVRLVNSVQAKIKKLPLSPFELAAKLSEEWAAKLTEYENQVGSDKASEDGFFRWLPPGERARAKQAFQAALVQQFSSSTELQLLKYVELAGQEKDESALITENVFRSKLIEPLLHLKPLDEPATEAEIMRSRERDNVVRVLNYLSELAFEPQAGADELTEVEFERRRRMAYQSSLAYIAVIIRQLFRQVLAVDDARALIEKTPTDQDWDKVREGIRLLVDHPVWTADFAETERMRLVRDALSKNQQANKAFGDVQLKVGYVVGADKLTADWNKP